jgi:hypothetical protein
MALGEAHCRAGCLYLGGGINSYIWVNMVSRTTVGITRRHMWIYAVSEVLLVKCLSDVTVIFMLHVNHTSTALRKQT